MTEFKGTPGPWVVGNNGYDIHKADQTFEEIATAFERKNAKIIAAAPEMFEALEQIISFNRRQAFDQYGDPEKAESWACVKTARKALNKALGKEAQND